MVGRYRARAEYAGGLGSQSVTLSPSKHFIDLLLLLLYPSTGWGRVNGLCLLRGSHLIRSRTQRGEGAQSSPMKVFITLGPEPHCPLPDMYNNLTQLPEKNIFVKHHSNNYGQGPVCGRFLVVLVLLFAHPALGTLRERTGTEQYGTGSSSEV